MHELVQTLEFALPVTAIFVVVGLFGSKPRTARIGDDPTLALRDRVKVLEHERLDLDRLCRLTLEYVERLHTVASLREIPAIALEFMVELFAPEEALVLIQRRPAVADSEREQQLIAAAVIGSQVRQGTVMEIGTGPLSRTATRGTILERQPAPEAPVEFRGFRPDLAVPMRMGSEAIGVLTVSGAKRRPPLATRLLQFIASAAAQTYKSSTTINRVRSEADLDALTGVLNKGALTQLLSKFTGDARQNGRPLSIFLFDIDNFKNYNDTNGHLAGDDCLRLVSRLVAERVRADDAFGRWGGEEFLLLLPGRGPHEALLVANEIRKRIAEFPFPFMEKQPLGLVSVSGGVACLPDHSSEPEGAIEAADRALYSAKRAGRNRVEIAPEAASPNVADEIQALPEVEDDLQRIQGIGAKFSENLRAMGFLSFRQIADLDWRGMASLAETLGTNPERILREQWLAQARALHREHHGEEL
ncbi:MAG: diguanylate cyclase [Acidobacteriota bacterium]|nr:diguanylate cyclase [Acidobacteriota bacterium]